MINSIDYQHPKDKALLGQLLDLDAIAKLFDWCRENQLDRILLYAYRASCPEITAETVPMIHDMVLKACELFGVPEPPLCLVAHDYEAKVKITGVFSPILLISDEYIRRADRDCLYGTIAGQIGGIALGHQRGIGLTWLFENLSGLLPVPGVALSAAEVVLNQWKRWRWFSCDRACLLATESETVALRTLLDWNVPDDILRRLRLGTPNDDYITQYKLFTDATLAGKLSNILNSLQSDTPWVPERYRELRSFYQAIFHQGKGDSHESNLSASAGGGTTGLSTQK